MVSSRLIQLSQPLQRRTQEKFDASAQRSSNLKSEPVKRNVSDRIYQLSQPRHRRSKYNKSDVKIDKNPTFNGSSRNVSINSDSLASVHSSYRCQSLASDYLGRKDVSRNKFKSTQDQVIQTNIQNGEQKHGTYMKQLEQILEEGKVNIE